MTVGLLLSRVRFGSVLLFAATSVLAATVSGVVTDPATKPAPGTRVTILHQQTGQTWSVTTDEQGSYRLDGLTAGRYFLSAEQGELLAAPRALELASATEQLESAIKLDIARVRTEVVVTASATAESADTVSRAVDVVRASDWQARGVSTLAEAVQQTPGLRVQNLGGPGAFTRILLRGLRSQDTAITVDGLRFRDAATTQGDATSFLETLMLAGSSRVEVLRGSGSALYGSNAVGGVINIVTNEGSDRWHGGLTGEGGGLAYGRGLLQLSGPMSRSLSFSGGMQHTNVSSGVDGQDPFRNTSLQTALVWKPTAGISLTGRLFGGDGFAGVNDSPFAAPTSVLPARGVIRAVPVTLDQQHQIEAGQAPQYTNGANLVPNLNDPDQHRASRFSAAALVFSHQLSPRLAYRASYQNVFTRRRFEDGPAGVRLEPAFRTEDRFRGQTDTVQARVDYLLAPQWRVGGSYEFEREDYQSRSTNAAPRPLLYQAFAGQRSHAAVGYVEGSLFANRLHVSVAGREQRFLLNTPHFEGGISPYVNGLIASPPAARTFDAGASWFVARAGTKLRVHAGNGYRAPSMFERFGMSSVNGVYGPNGDPRLRPDRTLSLDAGIDQYLWKERLRVSATSFYTDLREVIAFDSSGFVNVATDLFGRSSGYINTAGGIARGVETQVEAELPHRIRWVSAYTYSNSSQRRSTVRDNDFFKSPFVVPQQFSSTITVPVTHRLEVTTSAWIAGSHPTILSRRAFLFDGARRLDVAGSYLIPWETVSLRLQVRATNALDSRYLENGFRTPGRWATAGFTLSF
ncbi:MAG: TonB-dependent receptor [Bryobacteraceae bacterium]